MKAKSFVKVSLFWALLAAFVVTTSVVYALVITVDGDETFPDEWGVDAQTCTIGAAGCSRVVDDGQDVYDQTNVPFPYYDIDDFHVTNDGTNFYLRIDFLANGDATENTFVYTASGRPIFNICLDIDNSTTTGVTRSAGICDGNESMAGVDYILEFTADEFSPDLPIKRFIDCYDGSCAVGNASLIEFGYNADEDAAVEIGVPLSAFGVTSGTCAGGVGTQPCAYRLGGFYDNGIEPTDDSVPNDGFTSGTFGGGSPTAISLETFSVTNTGNGIALGLITVLVLGLVSIGLFLYKREKIAN